MKAENSRVYVKYFLCCISVPPLIAPAQTELSVIQGFQALLPCAAQGSPEPRVSWEKDGAIVPNRPGKFTVLRSGELIIERAEVQPHILHCITTPYLSSFMRISSDCFLHTVRRCRCVHMRGYKRSRLCETRCPPVHQHEACLQGAARRPNPEQRAEPGLVLPRSGNTFSCPLLDCQQQSLFRYSLTSHNELQKVFTPAQGGTFLLRPLLLVFQVAPPAVYVVNKILIFRSGWKQK